jgi:hypothetical protein
VTTATFRRGAVCFAFICLCVGGAVAAARADEPREVPILQEWHGDYPVSELRRLPEGQRTTRAGYLSTTEEFASIWQAFKPKESLPDVDFGEHIVVFSRNVDFYNRTGIVKVIVRSGVAEILAMETMSSMPIEEKVGMGLAVIPRAGVNFVETGSGQIPVSANGHPSGP